MKQEVREQKLSGGALFIVPYLRTWGRMEDYFLTVARPYDAEIEGQEMKLGIKLIVFMVVILSVFLSAGLCWANSVDPVVVDGDRLSVHAEGMPLGDLLMVVEDMTGVEFRFDELIATEKIFVDFKGLLLSEGIKKIIYSLSWATIHDDTGKLRMVIILGSWNGSGTEVRRGEESDSLEGREPGSSDLLSLTGKESPDSSGASKGSRLGKGPVYVNAAMDKAHSGDRPANTQNKMPEGLPVPSVVGSVHLPIPNSKEPPVVAPPVHKAHTGSNPLDTQDKIPEGLPIPIPERSHHLPIPDYAGTLIENPPGA